jgi:hypothetical protein
VGSKGVAEQGSQTKGGREGVWPKAEKKIVTSLILMVEVVVDVPKGTSDGFLGVQDVFELLYFKLLMCHKQCSNGLHAVSHCMYGLPICAL